MRYQEFIKMKMKDEKIKALPNKERFKVIAKMWKNKDYETESEKEKKKPKRRSKKEKTGEGVFGDILSTIGGPLAVALGVPELAPLAPLASKLPF